VEVKNTFVNRHQNPGLPKRGTRNKGKKKKEHQRWEKGPNTTNQRKKKTGGERKEKRWVCAGLQVAE